MCLSSVTTALPVGFTNRSFDCCTSSGTLASASTSDFSSLLSRGLDDWVLKAMPCFLGLRVRVRSICVVESGTSKFKSVPLMFSFCSGAGVESRVRLPGSLSWSSVALALCRTTLRRLLARKIGPASSSISGTIAEEALDDLVKNLFWYGLVRWRWRY